MCICASAIEETEPPYRNAIPGDTGAAPEGDLPQKEKHPPTTLGSLREGDQGSQSLLRRGRAGMTTPPSVVDTAAPEPSVDGMAPRPKVKNGGKGNKTSVCK